MIFSTIEFLIFFAVVLFLYWSLDKNRQNILLLIASYYFYGSWNWKFLFLIFFSTLVDYICGLKIYETDNIKTKKQFVFISLIVNLGALGFFKYFNFFLENVEVLFPVIGVSWEQSRLNIILPVGISFYTFQSLSYTIDIYREKLKPTKNFWDFALYVAFFPQLVAGPIERAVNMLPQFTRERFINKNQIVEGIYLFIWGAFKKIFIADNLAHIVNRVFSNPASEQSGLEILLGIYAFAFQIYGDFSGYSDMARGASKMMGFDLMVNFRIPYLAVNPSDFWRRWHISLSTWLRDYLYIPLGGNRNGTLATYRNLSLTMLLGGLWHGAAWTYVIWGAYHGVILIIHRLFSPLLATYIDQDYTPWRVVRVVFMFQITCIGWLIFRAESWQQIVLFIHRILTDFTVSGNFYFYLFQLAFYTWFLLSVQFLQELNNDEFVLLNTSPLKQLCSYSVIITSILFMGEFGAQAFIYFQF